MSLNVSEIRVGNYLQWDDDSKGIIRVNGINKKAEWDEWWIDWEDSETATASSPLFEFKGLNLSPGALQDLGLVPTVHVSAKEFFIKITKDCRNHKFISLLFGTNPLHSERLERFSVKDNNGHILFKSKNIKYVHRLQNLFFDLTGDEI